MTDRISQQDRLLIDECVKGSEKAWEELYFKHLPLVRSVVRRKLWFAPNEVEDATQMVFASLVDSLENYDATVSLARYICVIAERVCIQQYRRASAAKRDGVTIPVEHHDGTDEQGALITPREEESPESMVEDGQLKAILKRSLRALDMDCRKLLKYRYHDEKPFKVISQMMDASENTLAVRVRRCLDSLRAIYNRQMREGKK
jgi:RNA polymerase sigma factor (sigma-70 family)